MPSSFATLYVGSQVGSHMRLWVQHLCSNLWQINMGSREHSSSSLRQGYPKKNRSERITLGHGARSVASACRKPEISFKELIYEMSLGGYCIWLLFFPWLLFHRCSMATSIWLRNDSDFPSEQFMPASSALRRARCGQLPNPRIDGFQRRRSAGKPWVLRG